MVDRDEMENNWGCNLVQTTLGFASRNFHDLDQHVRADVRGFQLHKLEISGTAANEVAVELSTNYEYKRCLLAMGSYSGGVGKMLELTSTKCATCGLLSIPADPEDTGTSCQFQTVPMPYWVVSSEYPAKMRKEVEDKCLLQINKRLLLAKLAGEPFKAFFLELLLAGNGGELSNTFLKKLGILLHKYNIKVIVDEVLTGGRVGPDMTMTTKTPQEFQKVVHFITMGKITGCGLILEKAPLKPREREEGVRGISTILECGEAWQYWTEVVDRIRKGKPAQRRRETISIMKVNRDEVWGAGCLIFTSKSRPWVMKGLKNRLLPMLENTKIRKHTTKPSNWNRSTLCGTLAKQTGKWLKHAEEINRDRWPFLSELVDYIWKEQTSDLTWEHLEKFIGTEKGEEMAMKLQKRTKMEASLRNGKCNRQARTYIRDALCIAVQNAPEVIKRVRVGKKRMVKYRITRESL